MKPFFYFKKLLLLLTNKYIDFVRDTTSPASKDFAQLLSRMTELEVNDDVDVSRLLTAALGISAEAGEFTEIVKICETSAK